MRIRRTIVPKVADCAFDDKYPAHNLRVLHFCLISALRDASLRNEVSAVEARYAALGLIEDFMRSAAGSRKLSAYRDSYHRDFIFTVSLDEQDKTPVSCTTRELASV